MRRIVGGLVCLWAVGLAPVSLVGGPRAGEPAMAQAQKTARSTTGKSARQSQSQTAARKAQSSPSRTSQARRPKAAAKPRLRRYSSKKIGQMISEITALNQELAALNRRTTARLTGFAERQSVPRSERYRFPRDHARMLEFIRQAAAQPRNVTVRLSLADLYRRNHKFPKAERTLLEARALAPVNRALLFQLGELYLAMGRPGQGWDTFEEILYLDPGNLAARLGQGRAEGAAGRVDEAWAVFAGVENDYGQLEDLDIAGTRQLVSEGDYGAAIAAARQGLARYPDSATLYYLRGRAYGALGMAAAAKADLYDALALDADLVDAYEVLGDVSMQEGKYADASAQYLRVVTHRPGDPAAGMALGRAYLMDMKYADAVRELDLCARLHGERQAVNHLRAQAHYLQAQEFKEQGRFRQAVEAQRTALQLAGGSSVGLVVPALLTAGASARAHGDYRRSIDYYERALSLAPASTMGYVELSRTYAAMADSSQALEVLRKALARDPDHAEARLMWRRFTRP